jgi:hypothetical protein
MFLLPRRSSARADTARAVTPRVVQLTVDEQAAVRRDPRPVELELMAAVERDPKR